MNQLKIEKYKPLIECLVTILKNLSAQTQSLVTRKCIFS